MLPIEDYLKRSRIDPEKIGKDAVKLIEDAAREYYLQGQKEHPDKRYLALRADNKRLRYALRDAIQLIDRIRISITGYDSQREANNLRDTNNGNRVDRKEGDSKDRLS